MMIAFMLSYRHHFHAGNFADTLKHFCLKEILDYYNKKPTPYLYLDTHAGAGLYQKAHPKLGENREIAQGLERLEQAQNLPTPLKTHQNFLKSITKTQEIAGSPWIAAHLIRPEDQIILYERHPSDHLALEKNLKPIPRKIRIYKDDGFHALKTHLPHYSRRAVILIDPSYEEKSDCERLISAIKEGLKRLKSATYIIWYPQLLNQKTQALSKALYQIAQAQQINHLEITQQIKGESIGMYGHSLFILNPPYTLSATLENIKTPLNQHLSQDKHAKITLTSHTY